MKVMNKSIYIAFYNNRNIRTFFAFFCKLLYLRSAQNKSADRGLPFDDTCSRQSGIVSVMLFSIEITEQMGVTINFPIPES